MDPALHPSVVHIDELLSMIFAYLDDHSLARAACVSRHWSDLALDALWAEVGDLKSVLSVLAPLAVKPERVSASAARVQGAYAFKRPLSSADWQRFQRYSGRVRRLRHEQRHLRSVMDRARRQTALHPKVFDDLLATCPTPEIFPNLQSISWHACAPDRQPLCLTFMHRRVKHLGLHIYPSDPPFLTDYLRQVSVRCPNLTSLDLRLEEPMRDLEQDILVLLQGLPHLQHVSVPIYSLTPRLLTQLSRLQPLLTVSLADPARAEPGSRTDVSLFAPTLAPDAFPALRSLAFSSQVADATQLLRTSSFPERLSELHFKSIVTATPASLHALFCAVRDRCTSLVDLSVDYIIAPDSPLSPPPPPPPPSFSSSLSPSSSPAHGTRPSLATFRPLFAARTLRRFELRWDYALSLCDEDMDDFARSWPALESLQLNPEPVPEPHDDDADDAAAPPSLTLRALLPFAAHCPALRHLGLHIDARAIPTLTPPHCPPPSPSPSSSRSSSSSSPPPSSPPPPPPPPPPAPHHLASPAPVVPRFAHLRSLAVGLSAITRAEPVTLFLSGLLPPGCAVRCGLRWPDAFDVAMEHALVPVGVRAEMSACWVRWTEVARLLPVVTAARLEGEARVDALERAVRALEVERGEQRRRVCWLEREVEDLRGRAGRALAL